MGNTDKYYVQENQVMNIFVGVAKAVFGSSCMSFIEVGILLHMFMAFDMFRAYTANYIQKMCQ